MSEKKEKNEDGKKKLSKTAIILISVDAALVIIAVIALIVFNPFQKENHIEEPEATVSFDVTTTEAATATEVATEPEKETEPEFLNDYNPLTGLKATEELFSHRPVAIMINNIQKATPQIGISNADIIYECMVEGGITRLMCVINDYENMPVIGSIRSCREYYLDFAADHDAIYCHIGGSESAYTNIYSRPIDDIDGLRFNYCYRDEERKRTMGTEHSSMTTGELVANAVSEKGFRTTVKDGFEGTFSFIPYTDKQNATDGGVDAGYVKIAYNGIQRPEYFYDATTGLYSRYQFNHKEHIDGATGEIIKFKNVLVIVCDHEYTYDAYNHVNVYTTGSDVGYYFSNGKCIPVKWTRKTVDDPMKLFDENGNPLKMNCGKTFVNVVSPDVFENMIISEQYVEE